MPILDLIAALNAEIARLVQARDLLAGTNYVAQRGAGRPKASATKPSPGNSDPAPKKRTMSAEGKLRIAATQKKRWAKQRKSDSAMSKQSGSSKKPLQAKGSQRKLSTKTPQTLRSSSKVVSKQIRKANLYKKTARPAAQTASESQATSGL